MASNTRLGPGNLTGLASSLRSAAHEAALTSPTLTNNSIQFNNNNHNNHNHHGATRRQYSQDMDGRVPDEDDSTEEDEDYNSYMQGQEPGHHQNHIGEPSNIMNVRQMLREDEDEDMHDHNGADHPAKSTMDIVDTGLQGDNNLLVQARQNQILDEDEESFDEDDEDLDEDGSETLSLTEDDIDFNLVYAFHTFVATQEGQASVVRNDALMLLEDVNVYWWLVRVLKTGVIGYIPAENIETPFERLARLNKYLNVGLSAPTAEWGPRDELIQPLDPAKAAERNQNRRSVIFTNIHEYFGASETEWDDEDEEEDDDMEEYYEGHEGEEQDNPDESQQQQQQQQQEQEQQDQNGNGHSGKSALQLEAERMEQEILNEQKLQQSALRNDHGLRSDQGRMQDEESQEDERRHRRQLLDGDDLVFSDEPRKISLTPSIAQDDSIIRMQTPPGRAKKLRLADEESLNSLRSGGSPTQLGRQNQQSPGGNRSSLDSDEDERQQKRTIQQQKEARLEAILGKDESDTGSPSESKKPRMFKNLFGGGKGSKDKEKERKEKERIENEKKLQNQGQGRPMNKGISSANSSPGGNSSPGNQGPFRTRTNSNGSIGSFATGSSSTSTGPLSPSSVNENGDTFNQEIIALRVYPGNVDFGVSMYKTVVVSPSTMASEVASQAVIKFKFVPENVPSSTDFYISVRGVDGDEIVLQPTDKPMAIYQSLTAHLTTPLPANHRLSISSVSSMMSVNSTSSYTSNPPSTPTSPSSVKRIGSGRSDPNQRSIRFYLNKKIRRPGSISSTPGTPTTPTTPIHDDMFWVKVVCQAQELPQSMILLDGLSSALDKNDPRALGQNGAAKVEHWISMHSSANAGDVIFKTLELMEIHSGVVDGVPEHDLAAKRAMVPNGLVIEYQLGLFLNGQTSRRAKQGNELPLPPQTDLIRCFEDHQLTPVRRSPKADVASMPLNPDHVFFLRKAAKSRQAEIEFEHERGIRDAIAMREKKQQSQPKKAPAPLNFQSNSSLSASNDALQSPTAQGPAGMTSPRSLRSVGSYDDTNGSDGLMNGPASPGLHQGRMGRTQPPGPGGPRAGSTPMQGGEGIHIPRRTDSVIMSPTSPIRANSHENLGIHQHQQLANARTPTPENGGPGHSAMGRNRSPSVSQGLRPGQTPSPSSLQSTNQGGSEHEGIPRSSTPERPSRPERADRQRAISPSMTHGSSPLSLAAVALHTSSTSGNIGNRNSTDRNKIAPLNIKKNETQGTDIILDKGVIRSSRLLPSKQYRYSFIPLKGGEEVDISEIIEDILGEENGGEEDMEDHEYDGRNTTSVSNASKERQIGSGPARSLSNGSRSGRISIDRDGLELLTNSARGGSTLLRLEKALAGNSDATEHKIQTTSRTNSPAHSHQGEQSRTLASPLSLNSSPQPQLSHKRSNSDVEIQVASVATLSTRSASPMIVEQNGSRGPAGANSDYGPGSPRSLRAGSPFGGPKLNPNNGTSSNAKSVSSSPLKDDSNSQDGFSTARSFSPVPRRLQSPSPAMRQKTPSPRPGDPAANTISVTSGRASPASVRSNSGASVSSVTSARARSASASAATESSRLAKLNGNGKEWLLSSDYNAGMQDLLTLVRAGRSSSVSSQPSSSQGGSTSPGVTFRSGNSGGLNGPIFGKDGRIVALPSTIKASLLNSKAAAAAAAAAVASTNRNRSGSLSQLDRHGRLGDSSGLRLGDSTGSDDGTNDVKNEEQARMVLMMLGELTLKDVQQECHPDVYDCWKDVDADLDRVERELDDLLVTVKGSVF
ncbi:hypothetical protein EMPS_10243 [Entomortierella parvispora]|uniref:SH3 domain-containing protein n=1 Tax=Entomortierella parvispora TaxID=205924 RepID=A0A9P3HJG5_9FUNG|nr:hypothetical protein EMPS_10243 [Entomortierella parvispora]